MRFLFENSPNEIQNEIYRYPNNKRIKEKGLHNPSRKNTHPQPELRIPCDKKNLIYSSSSMAENSIFRFNFLLARIIPRQSQSANPRIDLNHMLEFISIQNEPIKKQLISLNQSSS